MVYVPPFGEELNRTRRMAALQSRALARAGFDVLQLDLAGCGDSAGQFADATWDGWVADVMAARAWLLQRHAGQNGGARHTVTPPVWLWSMRAGCLLAAEVVRRMAPAPVNLLFWQPVISGAVYLTQFLRLRVATDLVRGAGKTGTGRAAGDDGPGRPVGLTPQQLLAQGETIEVGGYALSPTLANALGTAHLNDLPAGSRLLAFEFATTVQAQQRAAVSPALGQQVARWQQHGIDAVCQSVQSLPFWQTPEVEVAPAVFERVVDALLAAPPNTATPVSGKPDDASLAVSP